jgi:hypothetical protein
VSDASVPCVVGSSLGRNQLPGSHRPRKDPDRRRRGQSYSSQGPQPADAGDPAPVPRHGRAQTATPAWPPPGQRR